MKIMKQTINPRKAIRIEIVTGYTGLQRTVNVRLKQVDRNGEKASPLILWS